MAVSSINNYVSSTKIVNIYSKQWDVKEIQEHPTCINLSYDGTRIRWSGSFDMLKEFVESAIKLRGKWSSPGGNSKKFTFYSSDITITWYAKKQNTHFLHGNSSLVLIDILIEVCNTLLTSCDSTRPHLITKNNNKLTNGPLESSLVESRNDANTNDIPANPAAVKVSAEMHEHVLENDVQADRCGEEGSNPSLCEYLRKPDMIAVVNAVCWLLNLKGSSLTCLL